MQCYWILKRNIGKKGFRVEGRTACFNGKESKQSEENEKAKANTLAQSKYDKILACRADLEDSLNEIEDWSKASRAEVSLVSLV